MSGSAEDHRERFLRAKVVQTTRKRRRDQITKAVEEVAALNEEEKLDCVSWHWAVCAAGLVHYRKEALLVKHGFAKDWRFLRGLYTGKHFNSKQEKLYSLIKSHLKKLRSLSQWIEVRCICSDFHIRFRAPSEWETLFLDCLGLVFNV